jgi:hypothetical protein
VTLGTFFGTGFEFPMALDALVMKRIAHFDYFGILDLIFVMTFQAGFQYDSLFQRPLMAIAAGPQRGFVVRGVMVAVVTGKSVSGVGRVHFVTEQHFARHALELDPHRFIQHRRGEGGVRITAHSHNQQNNGQTVSQLEIFL